MVTASGREAVEVVGSYMDVLCVSCTVQEDTLRLKIQNIFGLC